MGNDLAQILLNAGLAVVQDEAARSRELRTSGQAQNGEQRVVLNRFCFRLSDAPAL
jgi:hypothetical protein